MTNRFHRFTLFAFLVSIIIATVAASFLVSTDLAHAHQPEGLRASQAPVEDHPCPYGHDSGCDAAYKSPSPNPYQGAGPDSLISPDVIGNPRLHIGHGSDEIRYFRALNRAKPGDAGGLVAGSGDVGPTGIARSSLVSAITGLPWVSDGLTPPERATRNLLSVLHDNEPALATWLASMPFLQDYNPGDHEAVLSIYAIAVFFEDPDFVSDILAIPELADGGGLDNEEARIVSTFVLAYDQGRYLDIELLAEFGETEERTVRGRHGNSITFFVVRLGIDLDNSAVMGRAIESVSHAEELMGKALPTDFVAIAIHDGPGAGANNGISIRIDRILDSDRVSERHRLGVIAHEVGHYYWDMPGIEYDWLAEGAAQYIAAYAEKQKFGDGDLSTQFYPCPYYRTVEHLRADAPTEYSAGFLCNYSLGERLFINLGRTMTDSAFKTAFRKLHRDTEATLERDDPDDTGELLAKAFCNSCLSNPQNLGATGFTLARRYGEHILTDHVTTLGSVPRLGRVASTSIEGAHSYPRYYGFAEIPAFSPDGRRWVRVYFSNPSNPPDTVTVYVRQYHEDREAWRTTRQQLPVYSHDRGSWFYAYLGDQNPKPTGHHWVSIFNSTGQLIAKTEYQVMP